MRRGYRGGVVPGGGVALVRCEKALEGLKGESEDEQTGINIVKKALTAPLRQIAENSGLDGSVVVERVRNLKGNEGFNADTDTYEDLLKAGVVDPAKVVRTALENAASIASTVLLTEALIADKPEKKETPAMPPMGGMGGMGMM